MTEPEPAPASGSRAAPLISLRQAAPGYYRPSLQERADVLRHGTIALDTNVLLDAYRYTPTAREELLRVLSLVKHRLFVPHQVATEFHRSRLSALSKHRAVFPAHAEDLEKQRLTARRTLEELRRQSQSRVSDALDGALAALDAAFAQATAAVHEVAAEYDLDLRQALAEDHILAALDRLLEAAVAPQPKASDRAAALALWPGRVEARKPPGWEDASKRKDPENAAGDYLMWTELLAHAKETARPMLLVTGDEKRDWTRRAEGHRAGTHPELVEEMLDAAGVPFLTMNQVDLVTEASAAFGTPVSAAALEELTELDQRVLRRLAAAGPDELEPADWREWLRREHPELLLQLSKGRTVTQRQMRELLGALWEEAQAYRGVGGTWPRRVRDLYLRRAAIVEELDELRDVRRRTGQNPSFAVTLEERGYSQRLTARIEALEAEDAALQQEAESLRPAADRPDRFLPRSAEQRDTPPASKAAGDQPPRDQGVTSEPPESARET